MAPRFVISPLDWVSLILTVVAAALQYSGFLSPYWWKNEGSVGTSHMGMMDLTLCHVVCVDKTVLDLEGGKEWVLIVRVFEVFGDIFVLIAVLLAVLMVAMRRKGVHKALVYIHGAAALFILIGVFTFLSCHTALDRNLETTGSLGYPFALCIVAGVICIAASIVTGVTLKHHLVELDWDDDDDDDEYDIN